MKGYECARENEICKCGGNVNFGIDGGNEEFFGKWSDMTYVTDQINCTKENFEGYNDIGYEKFKGTCYCHPSSQFDILHIYRYLIYIDKFIKSYSSFLFKIFNTF